MENLNMGIWFKSRTVPATVHLEKHFFNPATVLTDGKARKSEISQETCHFISFINYSFGKKVYDILFSILFSKYSLKNFMIKTISFIAAVFLFSSCSNSSYRTDKRDENDIRIISLAPSITKELLFLGMADNIVGATSYCDISKTNKELIIGSATTINIEKILLLKPDIVFASGLTKANNIQTLKDNGIEVYSVNNMKSFDDICTEFMAIGNRVDKTERASIIINEAKQKVDSMRQSIASYSKKSRIFIQIGAQPLYTVIPNTFMNDYITFSGCDNIAHDMTRGTITRESVLLRNPDVIFIVTMGIIGDEEKNIWNTYNELNATKNSKIFIINSSIACTPSVLAFTETLEIIINNIYN